MNNHFPQNLSILRRKAGYTQETLAEALGVSRQAVGKWESGQALPEAATLLTMADLLGCSLDLLMREPLTEEGEVDALAVGREREEADQAVYDAYHAMVGDFSKKIAAGVFLVLFGVAMAALTAALGLPEWTAVAALFVFLIAGVYLFITAGMAEDDFKEEYPEVPPIYDPEEKREFQRRFRLGVALPIMGILADAALCGILGTMPGAETREMYIGALFLAVLTLCVTPLVYLGCLSARYELEEMSERERKRKRDFSGPIMILATAGFLLWGLMWDGWHVSWICFLIGAAGVILCKVVQDGRDSR
jgi:transcriptional regulator with XRE-family HTH domain